MPKAFPIAPIAGPHVHCPASAWFVIVITVSRTVDEHDREPHHQEPTTVVRRRL